MANLINKIKNFFLSFTSLGVFGLFSIIGLLLMAWSTIKISDLNNNIFEIDAIVDELEFIIFIEEYSLYQQLVEEIVVGELLVHTPFDDRQELETWLEEGAACEEESCFKSLLQDWEQEFTDTDPSYSGFFVNEDDQDAYCEQNPDDYACGGGEDTFCLDFPDDPSCNNGGSDPIFGCTDPDAYNYDSTATADDGSCDYPTYGCTDPEAFNFDPGADEDDGSCDYE